VGSGKRRKKKEKKKKKRRKKEKKRRLPNRACHSKVFFLECLLGEAWTIFEAIHRQFYENVSHPSRKKQVQNCTEWTISPHYVVDSGEHIGPEITKVLIKI